MFTKTVHIALGAQPAPYSIHTGPEYRTEARYAVQDNAYVQFFDADIPSFSRQITGGGSNSCDTLFRYFYCVSKDCICYLRSNFRPPPPPRNSL
jgi:hypothetical protein